MRMQEVGALKRVAALGFVLATFISCGLEEVTLPELDGPSGMGTGIRLTATPDLLVADGVSQSVITAVVTDELGRPAANREIFFTIADEDGIFAAIGHFPTSEGRGFAVSVRTDANGVARVVYQAPPRTDATADQTILIAARQIGTDANAAVYRTVRIELRSPEPRLFPPTPGNASPTCSFVIEIPRGSNCEIPPTPTPPPPTIPSPSSFPTPPPTAPPTPAPTGPGVCRNAPVLVQTTSSDPDGVIVRYLWTFGNGRSSDAPDSITSYSTPGAYTITHTVTDDDGASSSCTQPVTVVP